jgi:hypothetical protein
MQGRHASEGRGAAIHDYRKGGQGYGSPGAYLGQHSGKGKRQNDRSKESNHWGHAAHSLWFQSCFAGGAEVFVSQATKLFQFCTAGASPFLIRGCDLLVRYLEATFQSCEQVISLFEPHWGDRSVLIRSISILRAGRSLWSTVAMSPGTLK